MPLIAATKIGALVVGGVDVDDWVVVMFSLYPKVPVYHRFGNWLNGTPQNDVDATACGLACWNPDRRQALGTNVPTVHAEKFGRPCLRCFPEAREAVAYKREVESGG
jgi:hypothetical protein